MREFEPSWNIVGWIALCAVGLVGFAGLMLRAARIALDGRGPPWPFDSRGKTGSGAKSSAGTGRATQAFDRLRTCSARSVRTIVCQAAIPRAFHMKVFLSYRRADSAQIAGRIFDQLVVAYGRENVFKDVDSIALGSDFRTAIEEALSQCHVLIVLIGRHWLEATNEVGRRLDDPTDLVRLEVEGAFAKQLHVIPLLVDGQNADHRDAAG